MNALLERSRPFQPPAARLGITCVQPVEKPIAVDNFVDRAQVDLRCPTAHHHPAAQSEDRTMKKTEAKKTASKDNEIPMACEGWKLIDKKYPRVWALGDSPRCFVIESKDKTYDAWAELKYEHDTGFGVVKLIAKSTPQNDGAFVESTKIAGRHGQAISWWLHGNEDYWRRRADQAEQKLQQIKDSGTFLNLNANWHPPEPSTSKMATQAPSKPKKRSSSHRSLPGGKKTASLGVGGGGEGKKKKAKTRPPQKADYSDFERILEPWAVNPLAPLARKRKPSKGRRA